MALVVKLALIQRIFHTLVLANAPPSVWKPEAYVRPVTVVAVVLTTAYTTLVMVVSFTKVAANQMLLVRSAAMDCKLLPTEMMELRVGVPVPATFLMVYTCEKTTCQGSFLTNIYISWYCQVPHSNGMHHL